MIVGNKENFAIECYDDFIDTEKKYVFGRMCLWCSNISLGDIFEPSCMLNVTEGILLSFLEEKLNYEGAELNNINDEEAFNLLSNKLYGVDKEISLEQVSRDMDEYYKYDFLTNGGESFDGYQSFIIKNNNTYRIIFRDSQDKLYSSKVERPMLIEVINGFLQWVKQKKG